MSDDQFTKLDNKISGLSDQISKVDHGLSDRILDLDEKLSSQILKLDGKFTGQASQLDGKISKLTDLVMKLYAHTEKRFGEIEAKLDDKADKKQVDLILGTLDTVLKNQETNEQERLVMGHQLSRHEQWFDLLAEKAKIKLLPER